MKVLLPCSIIGLLGSHESFSHLRRANYMSPLGLLSRVGHNRGPEVSQSSSQPAPPKADNDANSDLLHVRIENEVVQLYDKYAPGLLRYGLAICGDLEIARDAVQETFLRYYIALRNESAVGDARGWLYSTIRNYILDHLKEFFFRNGQSLNAASRVTEDAQDPEAPTLLREIEDTAQRLLSPRELECLRLRSEGLRYKDIASLLQIESATVGVLLGRALRKIRAAVNTQENGR